MNILRSDAITRSVGDDRRDAREERAWLFQSAAHTSHSHEYRLGKARVKTLPRCPGGPRGMTKPEPTLNGDDADYSALPPTPTR